MDEDEVKEIDEEVDDGNCRSPEAAEIDDLCATIKMLSVQICDYNYDYSKAVTILDDAAEAVHCTFRKPQMAAVKKKQTANARQFKLSSSWVKPNNK